MPRPRACPGPAAGGIKKLYDTAWVEDLNGTRGRWQSGVNFVTTTNMQKDRNRTGQSGYSETNREYSI